MSGKIKRIIRRTALILWLPLFLVVFSIIYSRMNSDIGFTPQQPVEFSHKVHSGDYKIKCLFCHHEAESKSFSAVPTTQSCLVCHVALKNESELIKPLMDSYDSGKAIKWVRLHKLPEYVHFNHNMHLAANIDCETCHGKIENMERTRRIHDFTMSWCIDCHREPLRHIIPGREITGIFVYPAGHSGELLLSHFKPKTKPAYGSFVNNKNYQKYGIIKAKQPGRGPENCSACHY